MTGDPYQVRMLHPSDVSFSRGDGGVLQAVVQGTAYEEIALYRTFPLTRPAEYISVRTAQGEEIGVIADISELDPESFREAQTELRFRYLVPAVNRIDGIKQTPGLWIWKVQTNLGPMRLTMRNLHEHLQFPAPGRVLITDMDGRRSEIPDVRKLDARSRRELRKIM